MSKKLPAMQFYPGDWMKDPGVRACSLSARGLWFDLICLMWESPTRGVLLHPSGEPVTDAEIGPMVGETPGGVRRALEPLERVGVFSRDEDTGAIYCRRMIRDEKLRQTKADNGRQGGRPPKPKQTESETEPRGKAKRNREGGSSSSSSSSSSTSVKDTPLPPTDCSFSTVSFLAFWHAYPRVRRIRQGDCLRLWCEAIDEGIDGREIVRGATEYAASDAGRSRYALSAPKWLDGRCWLDDRAAWKDSKNETEAPAR